MNDSYCIRLAALDNFDLAVARFDHSGVLTYRNAAAGALLGVTPEAHVDVAMLFPNLDERERMLSQMRERSQGKSAAYVTAFHPPHRGPDAADIPVAVFAFPDADSDGQVLGSITLVRDLREERARDHIHESIEVSADNPEMFARVADEVRTLLDFEELRIITISESQAHFRLLFTTNDAADVRFPFRWWPLKPFLQETKDEWRALVMEVDGILADPRYRDLLARDEKTREFLNSGVRQVLSLPVYDENRIVAFFSLDSRVPGRYDNESIKLLERLPIAQAVLAGIHREQREQQGQLFRLIRDIGDMSDNVQGAAQMLVERLVSDFGWAHVSIFQCESSRQQFRLVFQANLLDAPGLPACFEVTGDSVSSAIIEAARTEEVVSVPHTRARGPLAGQPGFVATGSQLALPIQGRKVQWILNLESVYENAFSTEEIELLKMLAKEASSVLLRSALFELQQAVLSSINDAVIETNAQGWIRWSNRAAHDLLGLDVESRPVSVLDLIADEATRADLLATAHFDHHQVNLRKADGTLVPVILSGSTLPPHLSGRVYVASDYTYQKEVLRLTELKDVFRQAAMEGRVPLALATVWLRELAGKSEEMREAVDKIAAQLGRADLPLERLMRLFAADAAPAAAAPRADLNLALRTTLSELPKSIYDEVEPVADKGPLPVGVAFDNLQFCVESMISFGLRTRPQSKKLHVSSERNGSEAVFSVHGDWLPDMTPSNQPGPAEQSRRKSLSDLALGDSVIERIIASGNGRYSCTLDHSLCLRFSLPMLAS